MKFQKNYLEDKAREYEEKKKGKGKGGKKESEPAKQEEKEEELQLARGAVLKLTGLGGDVTREDIKEVLKDKFDVNIDKDGGDVAFITYEKGEAEAKIRFKTENFAKPIAEKWTETEELKEHKVEAALLEGEEEDKFLADSIRDLKNRRNKNKGHKRKAGAFNNH